MDQPNRNQRAVFLDRDGTLNRDVGFVHRVGDLELLDHVVAGLERMAALGFQLFITTNQSGVARGHFTEADMQAFNQVLCQQLHAHEIQIAGIYCCVFHPEGLGAYRRDSPLRKPRPGMIRKAASEHDLDLPASFTVGDKMSDVLAGQAAGCRTILLAGGAQRQPAGELTAQPDFTAANLVEAAEWIERAGPPRGGGLQTQRDSIAIGNHDCSAQPGSLH
jgi:D-glycero-D-manno-heptose 1,7-bisphosphate phosphatase